MAGFELSKIAQQIKENKYINSYNQHPYFWIFRILGILLLSSIVIAMILFPILMSFATVVGPGIYFAALPVWLIIIQGIAVVGGNFGLSLFNATGFVVTSYKVFIGFFEGIGAKLDDKYGYNKTPTYLNQVRKLLAKLTKLKGKFKNDILELGKNIAPTEKFKDNILILKQSNPILAGRLAYFYMLSFEQQTEKYSQIDIIINKIKAIKKTNKKKFSKYELNALDGVQRNLNNSYEKLLADKDLIKILKVVKIFDVSLAFELVTILAKERNKEKYINNLFKDTLLRYIAELTERKNKIEKGFSQNNKLPSSCLRIHNFLINGSVQNDTKNDLLNKGSCKIPFASEYILKDAKLSSNKKWAKTSKVYAAASNLKEIYTSNEQFYFSAIPYTQIAGEKGGSYSPFRLKKAFKFRGQAIEDLKNVLPAHGPHGEVDEKLKGKWDEEATDISNILLQGNEHFSRYEGCLNTIKDICTKTSKKVINNKTRHSHKNQAAPSNNSGSTETTKISGKRRGSKFFSQDCRTEANSSSKQKATSAACLTVATNPKIGGKPW